MGATTDTAVQYESVIGKCRELFIAKTKDYGTAWRVLRTISVIDQIYIKAYRIRTVQEKGKQRIEDDIAGEFMGIINEEAPEELPWKEAAHLYDQQAAAARTLMQDKNHDYGEAWREMSQESFVDLILMKLQRIRQIVANEGKTLVSEGIDANFFDIINYAVFALILLQEKNPAA